MKKMTRTATNKKFIDINILSLKSLNYQFNKSL